MGWDAAAARLLVLGVGVRGRDEPPNETANHARRQDPNPATTDALTLAASVASLVAVGVVLVAASSALKEFREWALAGLAVGSVASSWALVHTLFTLGGSPRLYHLTGRGVWGCWQDEPPGRCL